MFGGGYIRGLFTGGVAGICLGLIVAARSNTSGDMPTNREMASNFYSNRRNMVRNDHQIYPMK